LAKDQISFEIKSNLDKVAKQAKNLSDNVNILSNSFKRKNILLSQQNKLENKSSESVKQLNKEYQDLNSGVKGFIDKGAELRRIYRSTDNDIKKSTNSMRGFSEQIKGTVSNDYDKEFEKQIKKIREIENTIANSIIKTLDRIHNLGVQLTLEANQLKPFAMEFMNSFSFNPLKFFGAGQAMKESFELMKYFQQMRHELAALSDSSGDASKAVSLVYEVAGGSAVASGTATGILKTLADQGIIVNSELKSIGILSGNLQAATGIAASTWAGFTGELAFNYGIPTEGLENITSALIGTNLRGAQLEKAMQSVNKILQTTGFIAGKPTTESIQSLTKAVGGSMKVFQSMGISAEKAGGFIEGIVDPENFEKNAFLFAKMGINASEYADYLNDADGQQKLLQKTMENLPRVASEIANIQNPFARLQFAKTIGLDMQIVRNMAGKTQAEIQQMITEYEAKNKANEALEEKKKRMAAEAAKFDDMMMGLKLKVLAPIMKFLSDGALSDFISILPTIAVTIGRIFEAMVPILKVLTDGFNELVPLFSDFVERFVAPFVQAFPKILEFLLNKLPFMNTREGETGNETPAQKLFLIVSNILGYLTKIYLLVLAWKGLNFLGDSFNKIKGFFVPGQKRVIDATVDELAGAIRGTPMKGGGNLLSMLGLGTRVLGGIGLALGGGYLTKSIYEKISGNDDTKVPLGEMHKGDLASSFGFRASTYALPSAFGGFGVQGLKNISAEAKLMQELARTGMYSKGELIKGGAGSGLKFVRPLAMGYDAYRIVSADTQEEQLGAVGALSGGLLGGVLAGSLAAALPSGGTSLVVGGLMSLGLALGGEAIMRKYGASLDLQRAGINKQIDDNLSKIKDGIANGMTNIFNAFNLDRMDIVGKQVSNSINMMLDGIMMRLSKSFFLSGLYKVSDTSDVSSGKVNQANRYFEESLKKANLDVIISDFKKLEKEQGTFGTAEERVRMFEDSIMKTLKSDQAVYLASLKNAGLSEDQVKSAQLLSENMLIGKQTEMITKLNELVRHGEKNNQYSKKNIEQNQTMIDQNKKTSEDIGQYISNSTNNLKINISGGFSKIAQ